MILSSKDQYEHELKKLVNAEIDRLKEQLTTNHLASGFDFSSYKYLVGVIEGLRIALRASDDAEFIIHGRER